jgi:hypothetical protein
MAARAAVAAYVIFVLACILEAAPEWICGCCWYRLLYRLPFLELHDLHIKAALVRLLLPPKAYGLT